MAHKVQTQGSLKDNQPKKPKISVSRFEQPELFEKAQKEKKKKWQKKKRDKNNSNNPATEVNIIEVSNKKKKKKEDGIMCYNFNKKKTLFNQLPKAFKAQKLILVLATSILMIGAKKALALKHVPCIYYLIQFKKDIDKIQALIDSKSKINTMTPIYTKKLAFQMQKTNVRAQKIDESTLKIYKMVIAGFQVENKLEKAKFF